MAEFERVFFDLSIAPQLRGWTVEYVENHPGTTTHQLWEAMHRAGGGIHGIEQLTAAIDHAGLNSRELFQPTTPINNKD